jgi:hypothetical protein
MKIILVLLFLAFLQIMDDLKKIFTFLAKI